LISILSDRQASFTSFACLASRVDEMFYKSEENEVNVSMCWYATLIGPIKDLHLVSTKNQPCA